jgi:hypothetical protein
LNKEVNARKKRSQKGELIFSLFRGSPDIPYKEAAESDTQTNHHQTKTG